MSQSGDRLGKWCEDAVAGAHTVDDDYPLMASTLREAMVVALEEAFNQVGGVVDAPRDTPSQARIRALLSELKEGQ